jgi:hypothetical protein
MHEESRQIMKNSNSERERNAWLLNPQCGTVRS